jgi:hypothetical protein
VKDIAAGVFIEHAESMTFLPVRPLLTHHARGLPVQRLEPSAKLCHVVNGHN